MKTMTIALLKKNFSDIIKEVQGGEEITIEYGRSHKKIGVIVPYDKYKPKKRKLGILNGKASFEMTSGFKMTRSLSENCLI